MATSADPSVNHDAALPFPPSSSLPPTFVLAPAVYPQDLSELCGIYYDAFATEPENTFWWSPTREQMMRWLEYRVTSKFADPSVRHYKIVDQPTGSIVAWARWDIPEGAVGFGPSGSGARSGKDEGVVADVSRQVKAGNDEEGEDAKASLNPAKMPTTTDNTQVTQGGKSSEDQKQAMMMYPEGSNPAWCEGFFARLKQASEKWDASKMLGLSLIATAPSFQRRGAARGLIQPLLDVADKQGLKTYLEATPQGRPVYEKLGFSEVDGLYFDIGEITAGKLQGGARLSIMVREPGAGALEGGRWAVFGKKIDRQV